LFPKNRSRKYPLNSGVLGVVDIAVISTRLYMRHLPAIQASYAACDVNSNGAAGAVKST
jgi:hypothetical protein